MADPVIKVKRSAVAGKIPNVTSLPTGEFAINTNDGKVFIQQDQGVGIGSTIIVVNPWSVGPGTNTYNTYFAVGDVGIKTTTPQSALDVRGTISIGTTDVAGINSIRSVIDINSWKYGGVSLSVVDQDTGPIDIYFKDDGTKMYILGDTGNDVNEYTLSTPWEVNTASYVTSFSVAAQETFPTGLYFKPDGLSMYVCGNTGVAPLVAAGDYVHQYTLGTAWDISNTGGATVGWTTSFRVLEDTALQAVYLKNDDGTKMYVVGSTNDRIYEYALGTAWNVSTAGLTTSVLIGTGTTQNLSLTLTNPTGIDFNASGTKMYIIDQTRDVVARFDLSTPWDISTATFFDNVYIGFQELLPTGVYYQEDQSKAYIIGSGNDTVYQYNTDVPSLELASSGISTRSSIILNNEARLNDRLYVTGDTHVSGNTNLKGTLTVDSSATIGSNLTVSGGTITAGNVAVNFLGNTTTNIVMASSQTTGTLQIGGSAQTGTMTVGLSTTSQTTNIQAGVNTSGTQKTINFGTGGASGSRTLITVGSATAGAASTVTIPSPTNLLIGTATTTGTASQRLQVTGGGYFSGNVGIGTTNPIEPGLSLLGKIVLHQDSGSNNRLIFRGQPGSSYRWSIDNYSSANEFRIFREDDATSANGFAPFSISTTGTLTATKFSGDGSLLTNLPSASSQWSTTSVGIHTLSNVGIGTTNPTSKLTVSGSASISGILTVDQLYTTNNNNGQNIRIGDDLWIGDINLANATRLSGANDPSRAFIVFGNSDTVALGRTGSGPLYYGGDFTISGVSTANSFRARGGAPGGLGVNNNGYGFFGSGDNDSGMYSSADGQLEFYSNSSEVVRILAGGNVGINTTNPSQRLDVNGNIRIRNGLYDSNNQVGAANSILTSNGTNVVWSAPIQGATGAQGTTGSQGTQGVQGTTGTQGATGTQGTTGAQGTTGSQGTQGVQGTTGTQGTTGAQGTTGSQGTQGIQGTTGAQGATGTQGTTGAQGTQGIQGTTGAQGATGTQGTTGAQGTTGTQGVAGVQFTLGTTTQVATAGQTSFSVTYSVGFLEVYMNGIRLSSAEYTATNGTTVVLASGASAGDLLDFLTYTGGVLGAQGIQGIQGGAPGWSRKTTTYSAAVGDQIVADTSGGSWTLTLPATPVTGAYVRISDGANWRTNNLTVARNGSTIEGAAEDLTVDIGSVILELIYDGTTWEVFSTITSGSVSKFSPVTWILS